METPNWYHGDECDRLFFVVSGPSGVGKTTLIKRLVERDQNLGYTVSHTTRDPRPGEKNGQDYYFVEKPEFREIEQGGGFIETAEVFGEYYGTSRAAIKQSLAEGNCDIVMDIDVQGAAQIRQQKQFPAIFVFIGPPSIKTLRQRFQARNSEDRQQQEIRMEVAREELEHVYEFDYLVINDDLESALRNFQSVIVAERLRVRSQKRF